MAVLKAIVLRDFERAALIRLLAWHEKKLGQVKVLREKYLNAPYQFHSDRAKAKDYARKCHEHQSAVEALRQSSRRTE